MYNCIIEKYVKKLKIKDIINYGIKYDIYINEEEASIILNYIKNDWKTIMYENPTKIFNDLKNKINIDNYDKIIDLYYKMKEKYL